MNIGNAGMLCSVVLALAATATPQETLSLKVSCDSSSAISAKTTFDDLVRKFGKSHVVKKEVEIGEGESRAGIVLFAGDPGKELSILPKTATEPVYVVLRGERSQWTTDKGITLGARLKDMERLNGKAFTMTGFGWDYSGTVVDWNGGALQPKEGCRFQPRLDYSRDGSSEESEKLASQVTGDRDYSSSHPAMQALNPAVYEIVITFEH